MDLCRPITTHQGTPTRIGLDPESHLLQRPLLEVFGTQEVELANRHASLPQDQICRSLVEEEIWQSEFLYVSKGIKLNFHWSRLHKDLGVLGKQSLSANNQEEQRVVDNVTHRRNKFLPLRTLQHLHSPVDSLVQILKRLLIIVHWNVLHSAHAEQDAF